LALRGRDRGDVVSHRRRLLGHHLSLIGAIAACRAALISALHALAPRSHTGELIVEPWHASC
jgi:hypothetical protein